MLFKLDDKYFSSLCFGCVFTQKLNIKLSEQNKRRQEGTSVNSISYLFILRLIKYSHLDSIAKGRLLATNLKSENGLSYGLSKSLTE